MIGRVFHGEPLHTSPAKRSRVGPMTQRQRTSDDTGPWPAVEGERVGRRLATSGTTELTVAVAEEVPVAMVFNGTSHAVMIATPADLEDFGVGFALSEGILRDPAELLDIEAHGSSGGLDVRMTITQRRFVALAERRRTLAGRTGCGLCGIDSLAQVLRPIAPVSAVISGIPGPPTGPS